MSNPIIAFADDDKDDHYLFERALTMSKKSSQLICLNGGIELLQYLKSTRKLPSIILLDLVMPDIDGISCLSRIKNSDRLAHIPVIMYSTTPSPTQAQLSLCQGATHYAVKPGTIDGYRKFVEFVHLRWLNQ